ncbi:MAG TPA: ABC transporter permease [Candidatus Acidoferrales bacterium]
MRFLRKLFKRLINVTSAGRNDERLQEEIEEHLALQTADNIRAGMSPAEARRQAVLKFGAVEAIKEEYRAQRGVPFIETLARDLDYAFRMLRKNPGFTAVAILTLALGIGTNTTLFNAYNAIALKPLPVSDPGTVVRFERWFRSGGIGDSQYGFSYPEFAYVRDHQKDFSALVAASWNLLPSEGLLSGSTVPARMVGQLVSANYFSAFGIRPLLGRPFAANEDQTPGGNAVIVISYPFWRRVFQNDPRAIGQVVILNDVPFTIVGVAPNEFTGTSIFPQIPDFWTPVSMQAQLAPNQDWLHDPRFRSFQIFGRLKPSIATVSAQPEAELLIRQFASTYVETDKTKAITLQHPTYFPNTDTLPFRVVMAGLMLVVGLILFVACVNVANMLLARAAIRQREISTRRALGASRARIVRQLLAESILLAFFGAVAGIVLSIWTTQLLGAFLQRNAKVGSYLSGINLAPDWRVLVYALVVSFVAGTLLGLSPALHLVKQDLAAALKNETGSLGKISGSRMRSVLIGAQVAASVLLLAIAGLLTRGLVRGQAADPGFDIRDNFVLTGNLPGNGFSLAGIAATDTTLLERLRSLPEFSGVTLGTAPYWGTWSPYIRVGQSQSQILGSFASDGYFAQLRIPLVRGRTFTPEESKTGAPLAVVSEALARSFWPNRDPLGQTFALDMNFQGKWQTFQIIGVVKDVRFANITRVDPARAYLPAGTPGNGGINILVRVQGDQRQAVSAASSMVGTITKTAYPDLQLINIDQGLASQQRALSQSLTTIASILGVMAVSLAGVGIYGVLSYLVGLRTKEIGVRIALGARAIDVIRNIIVAGLRPVFGGMIAGIAIAAALSRLLHETLIFPGSMDFLYGIPFYDPVTFIGLFCFALAIAAVASTVPARRAMRVDPMVALRYE